MNLQNNKIKAQLAVKKYIHFFKKCLMDIKMDYTKVEMKM